MGRVAGAYGVRGWLKLAPERGVKETLAQAAVWWLGGRAHRVLEAKIHGAAVIGRAEGIETREQARSLKGSGVSMRRDALPEPGAGHYYLADLVGLEVVNEQGQRLGAVTRFFSNGAQDVMEVVGDATRLLPWVPAVVKEVDLSAGTIRVAWGGDW
ncbi:MAG TPA: ribosome maturation factor RimM [Burkholderiales bacterium]|nr:ribosome maturation factor RimM [Burkholderiales bacterium]